jgi:hypothetical protein
MSRPFPLSAVKAGMTRLLDKGGASKDSLYDLLNGYVDAARRCRIRHGHRVDNPNLAGTFGLIGWRDELIVFADHFVDVNTGYLTYRLEIITHPDDPTIALADIPFVGPIVGTLYVAATFADGSTWHYFLEDGDEWSPETAYDADTSLATPTTPNGYYYRPERLIDEYPAWSPGSIRAVGDRIEPTIENGFYYEVVAVEGTNPASGATEPVWPTNDGETVYEDTASGASGGSTPPTPVPPPAGGGTGGGGVPCVAITSWLTDDQRANYYAIGDWADLHDPQRGFFRGVCTEASDAVMADCVRLETESGAWLIVSVDTPVNFTTAKFDKQPGHWAWAPDTLNRPIFVDGVEEIVVRVDQAGRQLVRPLKFDNGVSFGASGERYGRKIYTHNMAKYNPDEDYYTGP